MTPEGAGLHVLEVGKLDPVDDVPWPPVLLEEHTMNTDVTGLASLGQHMRDPLAVEGVGAHRPGRKVERIGDARRIRQQPQTEGRTMAQFMSCNVSSS